jgi:undecaprenyl diphosphate synthase
LAALLDDYCGFYMVGLALIDMKSPQPISCIGFIMDGNRRFAKEQGIDTLAGHSAGKDKLLEVVDWVVEAKIPHAVFYAFSTENWKRDKTEVVGLMNLFSEVIKAQKDLIKNKKITLKIIGKSEDLPAEACSIVSASESEDAHSYPDTTIWIAFSYGGRAEIIAAVNKAVEKGGAVNEESFSQLLWTASMPDPDLIIRTGGESRLSNFLPWQAVYSELFFTKTYWPAFTKAEFQRILNDYAERERRIGK